MQSGDAKRLMIFFDEGDKFHGVNLAVTLIEKLRKEGCSGATQLRGAVGFGVHGMVHTVQFVEAQFQLPIVVIVIDEPAKIDRVLPMVEEMVTEGLIVVDDVRAIRRSKDTAGGTVHAQDDLQHHLVEEYMDRAPVVLAPELSVEEAIKTLVQHQRAYLPVVNDSGVLLGVISSHDLLARVVHVPQGAFRFFSLHGHERQQTGEEIKRLTVSQVMRTQVAAVSPNTPMTKAVQVMMHDKLSALPVVSENLLVGILRLPDVLKTALSIECQSTDKS